MTNTADWLEHQDGGARHEISVRSNAYRFTIIKDYIQLCGYTVFAIIF